MKLNLIDEMNPLNLRVSTVKTGDSVKRNSELRETVMRLPEIHINSSDERIRTFRDAETVAQQVAAVRKIFLNSQDKDSLKFLSDLYLKGPLKHPVRNQISKFFQDALSLEKEIEHSMNAAMKEFLESVENERITALYVNTVITSLSGCCEHFSSQIVKQHFDKITSVIIYSLKKYFMELPVQTSPSVRNEYYLYIHNSIRLALSNIQIYHNLNTVENVFELFEEMHGLIEGLMCDGEIPMDTRRNVGLFEAYFAKFFVHTSLESYFATRASTPIVNSEMSKELCLSAGIINTMTFQEFTSYHLYVKTIIEKVIHISNLYSTEPNMILLATRCLHQASKNFHSFKLSEDAKSTLKEILNLMLEFCIINIESYLDSVKHLCKDTLKYVIKLIYSKNFKDLLEDLFKKCNSSEMSIAMKCTVILCSAEVLGSNTVLEHCPTIFEDLFEQNLDNDLSVTSCFERLMMNNYNEMDFLVWTEKWIFYLIDYSNRMGEKSLDSVESLVNKAVKHDNKVLDIIVHPKKFEKFKDTSIPLRLYLSTLGMVRKHGLGLLPMLQSIIFNSCGQLNLAILSNCESTKSMALKLLVETRKTTEVLSHRECDLIHLYVKFNINIPTPSTREKSLALLQKFLVRLEISLAKTDDDFYVNFLLSLNETLAGNLFEGANFSRRHISLHLLKDIAKIASKHNLDITKVFPTNITQLVFEAMNDTYEANKILAVEVLIMLELIGSIKPNIELSLDSIYKLMKSTKPSDSLTAVYYAEYFCHQMSLEDNNLTLSTENLPSYKVVHFTCINWFLTKLEKGLNTAKESILIAAKRNPLYGILYTIRHLLSKLDFVELARESVWIKTIHTLIDTCKGLIDVASPVVNSSSPEGHLPNDFSDLPKSFGFESICPNASPAKVLSDKQDSNIEDFRTTSQMVLLCAWRTVKEVSLTFGELCLRAPVETNGTIPYLLTVKQILEISVYFKKLLSETKHRGAFEQAFVGFSKLCIRLWNIDQPILNELPMVWLKELMDIISSDVNINEKICATRRSAGVPFMVQALITSELQVGSTKSFNYCMKHLIELTADRTKSVEARVHAMNILRALFRCTDLHEAIGEYVAEGIKCAIQGYDADTWSERNSSTLLFSSLITRVFGVQRTRDSENLNIRNKMTGRIFFLRYPSLYDFFLEELSNASSDIKQNKNAGRLFPLLLILGRLYPSSLEGSETNLKMDTFLPLMSACSSSPDMRTRILVAKAIVPLVAPCRIEDRLKEVLMFIQSAKSDGNSNYVHGLLLQIFYFLKKARNLKKPFLIKYAVQMVCLYPNIRKVSVILTTFLEIQIEILSRMNDLLADADNSLICFDVKIHGINENRLELYPKLQRMCLLHRLHVQRLMQSPKAMSDTLVTSLKLAPIKGNYEKIKTAMDILFLIIIDNPADFEDIEDCETDPLEEEFVNSLNNDLLKSVKTELRQNQNVLEILTNFMQRQMFYFPEGTTKAYALLGQEKRQYLIEKLNILDLISEFYSSHGDLKTSLAICIKSLLCYRELTEEEMGSCMEFLKNLSEPQHCVALRLIAIDIMRSTFQIFKRALHNLELRFPVKWTRFAIRLLNDDDDEVRKRLSQLVLELTGPKESKASDYVTVSSYAQRVLLQLIVTDLIDVSRSKEAATFARLFFDELANEIYEDEVRVIENNYDSEVFGKNEVNTYAEAQIIFKQIEEVRNYFK